MENTNLEATVDVLANLCDAVESLAAVQVLLDAIFYLRAGHYPFNRVPTFPEAS